MWTCQVKGVELFLIEPHTHDHLFEREKIYGYDDDIERFTYFSRAALEFLLKADFHPDILHLHEWHSAVAAPLYWDCYRPLGLENPGVVYTIHNLHYQGVCSPDKLEKIGLDSKIFLTPDKMQDNQDPKKINLVKGGLAYSNFVTTVSPTYAEELILEENGDGSYKVRVG